MKEEKFLIIEKSVLPEVFEKVLYASSLLETGEAKNTSEATKKAGISRSVYYKYKDSVFPYTRSSARGIMTVQVVLSDRPGVLANFLSIFHEANANILTVTQNIPIKGRAYISVSASTVQMNMNIDELLYNLKNLKGVLKVESLSN